MRRATAEFVFGWDARAARRLRRSTRRTDERIRLATSGWVPGWAAMTLRRWALSDTAGGPLLLFLALSELLNIHRREPGPG